MTTAGDLIDLGPGRVATPRYIDGTLYGFDVTHPCSAPSIRRAGSWIPTLTDSGWTLVTLEPLTLSPSLSCRVCGDHGWIRDGHWVPA